MNRIEAPETNTHLYDPLIMDKEGKNIRWGRDSLLNSVGKIGQIHAKKKNDHQLTPYTRINPNWTKDKCETCSHKTPR